MRLLLLLRRHWPIALVGFIALLVGYGLGNVLPLRTAAKPAQLAYLSNGFVHILDLATGRDTNVGNRDDVNRSAVSPDGQWVASWTGGNRARWSLGILSTTTWQRTELGDFDIAFPTLSWSPDGKQLAFAAEPEGQQGRGFDNSELFLMDVASRQTQQLTDNNYRDDSPAFSPDGKQLAYTSSADGYNRLYIIDIATRESRRVTDQAFGYIPSWSPDGSQIAFVSNNEDRNNQVYIVDTDGTNLRRLTFNTATNEFPFWLP